MGREWLWSRPLTRGEKENPGCMSGMLHYLDFHHLLFTSGHGRTSVSNFSRGSANRAPPLSSPYSRDSHASNSQCKGLEAPRNSLELDDGKTARSMVAVEEEFYVEVPAGIKVVPVASKMSSSQAETPRTSSVVARLMGLEMLPEQASLSGACSPMTPQPAGMNRQSRVGNGHKKGQLPQRQPLRSLNLNLPALSQLRSIVDANCSLSLPESPRASVSSTRSWDPRLSRQLNKDNSWYSAQLEIMYSCEATDDYSLPTSPTACVAAKAIKKRWYASQQEENRSSSSRYHTREIVKRLKETVSSRTGGGGDGENGGNFEKSSSPVEKKGDYDFETQNQITTSVTKSQVPPATPRVKYPQVRRTKGGEDRALKPPLPPYHEESRLAREEGRIRPLSTIVPNKCRKAAFERFTAKIKKQSPAKENNNRRPTFSESLPASALTKKQIALHRQKKRGQNASSTVTSRRKEASASPSGPPPPPTHENMARVGNSGLKPSITQKARHPTEQDPEYRYVKSILERSRITGSSNASCLRWHSPALPVDPVLFHQLEVELQEDDDDDECRRRLGPLRHRWNRKLLFHVVEEILADLLLEWSAPPSSATLADHVLSRESSRSLDLLSRGVKSPLLLRQLWSRIRSYPEADCRVVDDIYKLAAGDFSGANTRRLLHHPSVVEEAKDVVAEVEQDLLDFLIRETAAWLVVALRRGRSCASSDAERCPTSQRPPQSYSKGRR